MDDEEILVLCSDGLIERRTEVIDVGMARLEAAVRAVRASGIQAIANTLFQDLVANPPADDVVFIVTRLDTSG